MGAIFISILAFMQLVQDIVFIGKLKNIQIKIYIKFKLNSRNIYHLNIEILKLTKKKNREKL